MKLPDPVAYVMLESWLTGQTWPDDCFMATEKPLVEATPLYTADQLKQAVRDALGEAEDACDQEAQRAYRNYTRLGADPYSDGECDGAGACAAAIRAMIKDIR